MNSSIIIKPRTRSIKGNPFKLVHYKYNNGEAYHIRFRNMESEEIDPSDPNNPEANIVFFQDVAPRSLEDSDSIKSLLHNLTLEIKNLCTLREITQVLAKEGTKIDTDFYWGETDLNIYLRVPIINPKIQQILKLIPKSYITYEPSDSDNC